MDTILLLAAIASVASLALIIAGLVVLHLRLRNARTLSALASALVGLAWLFGADPFLDLVIPIPAGGDDAAELMHMGREHLVHSVVSAAIALWLGISFYLAVRSCPKAAENAV